jgi:uncharacterized membrane protein YfhO
MLVVSETFYPAWRAYIDGHPAHIYVADYMFRAVAVPAGEHQVEMRYKSASFQLGLLVSATTLILVSIVAAYFLCLRPGQHRDQGSLDRKLSQP